MLRPTRRFLPLVLVPLLALATVGCGGGGEVDLGGAPVEAGGGASVPVPTLPSVADRQPGAYDEEGCARVGPDQVDCAATAENLDRAATEPGDGGWRTLAGFVGPHFVTEVTAGTVVLLDTTLITATSGPWSATGLVRNETTGPVTGVTVEAVLLDADGVELERSATSVPVDPVRAGEPAPFEIEATTPAESIADVQWSVTAAPSTAGDARVIELVTWWDRAAGDPEPVDLYLYRDDPAAPLPYLLFGAVTNFGADPIGAPVVVAAWVDEQGRVIAVEQTDAITDPVAAAGGAPLAANASADFLFVLDAGRPPAVATAQVMLWGVAR